MKVVDYVSEPISDSIQEVRHYTHTVMRAIRRFWVPAAIALAFVALPVDENSAGTAEAGLRSSEYSVTKDDDFYAESDRAALGFEIEDEEPFPSR